MRQNEASFRDPAGHVFEDNDKIYRTISPEYKTIWQECVRSELISAAETYGFVKTKPVQIEELDGDVLECKRIPVISYPYEWCFGMLKEAALLTLNLQKEAVNRGFVLKDASAYNVQFNFALPKFIDVLSFEPWKEGSQWQAYRQFCMHFLAPLVLAAHTDMRLQRLLALFIDGIPLDLACSLLPFKAKLTPGIAVHLFFHALGEKKHANTKKDAPSVRQAKKEDLQAIVTSLTETVTSLHLPNKTTEWSDYYTDTNYGTDGEKEKMRLVERIAEEHADKLALDLGANTGKYAWLCAKYFDTVIACDKDCGAVENLWQNLRKPSNILPLVVDLANPSPAIGFANRERPSFAERARSNFVMGLALLHHFRITDGLPFSRIVEYFSDLTSEKGTMLLEYIPIDDSQCVRLLRNRDNVFSDYNMENLHNAMQKARFSLKQKIPIAETKRTLLVYAKE